MIEMKGVLRLLMVVKARFTAADICIATYTLRREPDVFSKEINLLTHKPLKHEEICCGHNGLLGTGRSDNRGIRHWTLIGDGHARCSVNV